MRNFFPEYKITHLPANTTNWQQTSFATILPNRLNLHWNLIWADSIIALPPSMRASNRMLNQALSVYAQMLPDKLDKYVDASVALCRNYGFTKEYGKALEILTKAEKLLPTGDKSDKMGEILRSRGSILYRQKNNMQKQQQTTNRLQTFTKFFPAVM